MNRNQTETGDPEDREKYESAVLEFLDKEMAAVQPQKKNDQADELDALVTDLLKQVITESDEKPSSGKHLLIDEEDELFAGLTPSRENPLHAEPAQAEQPPASATSVAVHEAKPASTAAAIPFAAKEQPKRKLPMKVIAFACILVAVGAGVYFFTNSSEEAANPETVQQAVVPPPPVAQEPTGASAAAPVTEAKSAPAPVKRSEVQPPPTAATASNPKPVKVEPPPAPEPVAAAPVPPPAEPEPVMAARQAPVVPVTTPPPAPPVQPSPSPVVEERTTQATAPPVIEKPAPVPSPEPVREAPQPTVQASKPAAPPTPPPTVASKVDPPAPAKPQPPAPKVSGKATAPVLISQTSPVYPELAVRTRVSGSVVLDLQIDAEGKVVKATPVSGPIMLRDAAVKAALKWRYKPASLGGSNVASNARVTMVFNMK